MTNDFKLCVLVLGLFFVIFYGLGKYTDMKSHDLDVLTEIRLCYQNFKEKTGKDCAGLAKKQLIFKD
jgi:hypothetical protein